MFENEHTQDVNCLNGGTPRVLPIAPWGVPRCPGPHWAPRVYPCTTRLLPVGGSPFLG